MSPRGRQNAEGVSGPKVVGGAIEVWLDSMEAKAKAQAQKGDKSPRRPDKEIVAASNGPSVSDPVRKVSNVNGPHVSGPIRIAPGTGPPLSGPTGKVTKGKGLMVNNQGSAKDNGLSGPTGNAHTFDAQACASLETIVPGSSSHSRPGNEDVRSKNDKAGNARGAWADKSKGSWADKVRASSAKSRFCLDSDLVQEYGQEEYALPDELIEEDFGDWTRCLVGFIPGSPFPFYAARAIALREWKIYGIETVYSYEGFFIFRFPSEEKVHEVLADGPWLFGGKFMMLQQWHACFVFDKSKLSKVPVWVKLKGFPFTLWTNKALSFVAGIVGKPLSCDRATHERSRLSYARVCVEVDANKPYVHHFILKCKLSSDPIQIGVEYEWKPQRCATCCVYGHNCERAEMTEKRVNSRQAQERKEPVSGDHVMQNATAGSNRGEAGPNVSAVVKQDLIEVLKSGSKRLDCEVDLNIGKEKDVCNVQPSIGIEVLGNEEIGATQPSLGDVGKDLPVVGEASSSWGSIIAASSSPKSPHLGEVSPLALAVRDARNVAEFSTPTGSQINEVLPLVLAHGDSMDNSIVAEWEKRDVATLAFINNDMEALGIICEGEPAVLMDKDGVLMVDPIISVGATEDVCRLNQSGSKGDSALNSKSVTPGKVVQLAEEKDFLVESDDCLNDAAHSVKPLRPKRKGKQRRGAPLF